MMRAYIVLWLVAAASSDKLGYNYSPVGHSDNGLSFAPGGTAGSIGGTGGSDGVVGGSGNLGGIVGPASGSGSVGPSYSAPAEFNKEFFTFTVPEQEFDDPDASQQAINSLKKKLRVVFIKGPENRDLENAALQLAKQAAEDKTAIYVLQKQSDISDLANKLNAIHGQSSHKPEVHFVKYRTPEDAANAQKAIKSQYDQLGGNSHSHNGGIVPVHNFASQAPAHAPEVHAPLNAYLPSFIFRV